jgi:hypothetical protein
VRTTEQHDQAVRREIALLKWAVWRRRVVEAGYFDPAWLDMQGSPGFLGRGSFTGENRQAGYEKGRR